MLTTGTRGRYRWLTSDQDDLDSLLQKCSQIFVGRYVAITSWDSGSYNPTDQEMAEGWLMRNGITYSPRIADGKKLPTAGWDEWYVFDSPPDLGQHRHDNPFEATLAPGQVWALVNFNFDLRQGETDPLVSLFWKQFDWIGPEFYVAGGYDHLTFVTSDDELLTAVGQALQNPEPDV